MHIIRSLNNKQIFLKFETDWPKSTPVDVIANVHMYSNYVCTIMLRNFALDSEHHGRHEKNHFNAIYHGKSVLQLRNGHSRPAVMNSLVLLIHAIRATDVMRRLMSDRRPPLRLIGSRLVGGWVYVCVTHCLCDLAAMFS